MFLSKVTFMAVITAASAASAEPLADMDDCQELICRLPSQTK